MVIMLISVLVTSAYAASQTVYIYDGSGPVHSAYITSYTGAQTDGWNYTTSGHSLYCDLQAWNGSSWPTIKSSFMAIGGYAHNYSTAGYQYWRVQLNPELYYTDCNGKGIVSTY